jgi:hypothetical protein
MKIMYALTDDWAVRLADTNQRRPCRNEAIEIAHSVTRHNFKLCPYILFPKHAPTYSSLDLDLILSLSYQSH